MWQRADQAVVDDGPQPPLAGSSIPYDESFPAASHLRQSKNKKGVGVTEA
jgi:hypothetical protein